MKFTHRSLFFAWLVSFAALGCSSESDSTAQSSADDASTPSGDSSSNDATATSDGSISNDAGPDGASGITPLPAGPYSIVYAGTTVGIDMRNASEAAFDSNGLTGYKASDDEHPEIGTNQNKEVFSDGKIMIGRWAGGKTGGKFYAVGTNGQFDIAANSGFHYAIGVGVSPLPSTGKVTYALAHKTSVTRGDGTVMPGTVTGSLGANFAGGASKIGFAFTLTIGSDTYNISTTGGAADPSTSSAVFIEPIKGAFSANINTLTGPICGGSGSCSAAIDGFVGGTEGDRAGIVIHLFAGGGGTPTSISVAAEFEKE